MNSDQLWSFARGVLKAGGGALLANGLTKASVAQWVSGAVMAMIGFAFSHWTHADAPAITTSVPKP